MAKAKRPAERREDALSHERIVGAATELLDEAGENGLTFRALATRLETGPGAIYWHVTNKSELLASATDAIVTRTMRELGGVASPREAIHEIALAVYNLIDAHPWVGTQLSRAPWETAMLQIFERIGQQVQAIGVQGGAQFTAASALLSYIIGTSMQNATNGRLLELSVRRDDFLETVSAQWKKLDAREYPFTRNVAAAQLPGHDDRTEFLAGVDIVLAGIAAATRLD